MRSRTGTPRGDADWTPRRQRDPWAEADDAPWYSRRWPSLRWTSQRRTSQRGTSRRLQLSRRTIIILLLGVVLGCPLLAGGAAFVTYQQLRSLGQDAVGHLLAAKSALLPDSTGSTGSGGAGACGAASAAPGPTPGPSSSATSGGSGALAGFALPDTAHLATAQREFGVAQQEFGQLATLLDFPNPVLALAGDVSSLRTKLETARQLVYVGNDAATIGLDLTAAAAPMLAQLHTGALANAGQPLMTSDEAAQLRAALVTSVGLLDDIQARVGQIQPSQLPVSACQRVEFVRLTGRLGELRGLLAQAPALFDMATWALGIDQPRQFLVQTMDRAELRPTGGFTGDFGVLTLRGGRSQPFTLYDVDRVYLNSLGWRPPNVYDWWPFPNWGLRDSNLSPDFPTTARIVLQLFQAEHVPHVIGLANPTIDGVIQLTPVPIAHVLLVTGPIAVPVYGDIITAGNLETKIHYYQQDPAGIARETQLSPDVPTTPRKRFTYVVSHLLEDHIRHLSASQLVALARILLKDVQSRDIQVYLTNPQAEGYLLGRGYAGHLTTTAGQDSLMIDQANVSVSKATPYIKVSVQDEVALDARGGATHHLTMMLHNSPTGPYYGFPTYHDYVRIYVPRQSQLSYANGFDTGNPLCWAPPPWEPKAQPPARFNALPLCSANPFPDGSLSCPPGFYGPGPRPDDAFGGDHVTNWPVNATGWPTNYASDVAGLGVFAGYVTVPQDCTATLTLTWYVHSVALPSRAVPTAGPAYTLVVERQAGTDIALSVRVQPAPAVPGEAHAPIQFTGTLDRDLTFSVARAHSSGSSG